MSDQTPPVPQPSAPVLSLPCEALGVFHLEKNWTPLGGLFGGPLSTGGDFLGGPHHFGNSIRGISSVDRTILGTVVAGDNTCAQMDSGVALSGSDSPPVVIHFCSSSPCVLSIFAACLLRDPLPLKHHVEDDSQTPEVHLWSGEGKVTKRRQGGHLMCYCIPISAELRTHR